MVTFNLNVRLQSIKIANDCQVKQTRFVAVYTLHQLVVSLFGWSVLLPPTETLLMSHFLCYYTSYSVDDIYIYVTEKQQCNADKSLLVLFMS